MTIERIDIHPTHKYQNFKLRRGHPFPFGATLVPGGVNFSIYSRYATSCTLVLFKKYASQPMGEILFPEEFRIGNVYSMVVFDLDYENIEYGYRFEGPNNFTEGHWFDKSKILLDPYAKIIGGRDIWGITPDWNDIYQHRARIAFDDFEAQGKFYFNTTYYNDSFIKQNSVKDLVLLYRKDKSEKWEEVEYSLVKNKCLSVEKLEFGEYVLAYKK